MLLLGWNFDYERGNTKVFWRTDSCLRELSGYYVAMEEVAEMYPPKRAAEKNLFMLPYNPQPENSNIYCWSRSLPGSAGCDNAVRVADCTASEEFHLALKIFVFN